MATIIISAIVFGLMVLVIYNKIKKYQKGESTCGCGCSTCASAQSCHPKK